MTINNHTLAEYEKYYFKRRPGAAKKSTENPYHNAINLRMITKHPLMHTLTQGWTDFIRWFIDSKGFSNLYIDKCDIHVKTFYKTNRRHTAARSVMRCLLDGFAESGFIINNDNKRAASLLLERYVDKDNPRMEIQVMIQ